MRGSFSMILLKIDPPFNTHDIQIISERIGTIDVLSNKITRTSGIHLRTLGIPSIKF